MRDDKNNSSGWPLGDSPEEFDGLWQLAGAWRGGPEPQVEGALERLHERLASTEQMRRRTLRRRWSIAAAVLLLLAAALVFRLQLGTTSDVRTVRTAQAIATVELPDGSRVILNKNSELAWLPNAFATAERLVELNGEALFEVRADVARPFRVVTEKAEIFVTGTSFNVRAYPGEKETEVAVLTGRVTLRTGQDSLQLGAEQCARFTSEAPPRLEAMNVANAIAWQTGQLVFRDSPLDQVVRQLEHFFAVEIEWDASEHTSQAPCTVSAMWRDPELDHVLNALEKLTGLHPERLSATRYRLVGRCSG